MKMWAVVFHDGREPLWFGAPLSWAEAEMYAAWLNDLIRTDIYRAVPVPFAA
jgi:hypothetical protein